MPSSPSSTTVASQEQHAGQLELNEEPLASADDSGSLENGPGQNKEEWIEPAEPPILDTEADGVAGVLNRVLSRISTSTELRPGPPPDGGREAWTICMTPTPVLYLVMYAHCL